MELTEDEVIQILKLIEESSFDELNLTMGDIKLVVKKKTNASVYAEELVIRAPAESVIAEKPAIEFGKENVRGEVQKVGDKAEEILEDKLLPIKSPMLGTFYRRPAPGSPPYVEVGSFVEIGDTICLIEVMKVFNAVKAEVRGYIAKILQETGGLVEYGQTLFLISPVDRIETKETKS
jgi:acetyl-CoA carboxylase biotin carboxyl carrier protein